MFLEVANNIPIKVGDIMNWKLDDGTVEKWLLLQEEKKVLTNKNLEMISKIVDHKDKIKKLFQHIKNSPSAEGLFSYL